MSRHAEGVGELGPSTDAPKDEGICATHLPASVPSPVKPGHPPTRTAGRCPTCGATAEAEAFLQRLRRWPGGLYLNRQRVRRLIAPPCQFTDPLDQQVATLIRDGRAELAGTRGGIVVVAARQERRRGA